MPFVEQYLMAYLIISSWQKSQSEEVTAASVGTSGEPECVGKHLGLPSVPSGAADKPVDLSARKEADPDSASQGNTRYVFTLHIA